MTSCLQKCNSETELDQLSCPSEIGDDQESIHSAADHSDAASVQEAEYVNPRGVRFTQHQVKDGQWKIILFFSEKHRLVCSSR